MRHSITPSLDAHLLIDESDEAIEDETHGYFFKGICYLVLFFFTWYTLGIWKIAEASQHKPISALIQPTFVDDNILQETSKNLGQSLNKINVLVKQLLESSDQNEGFQKTIEELSSYQDKLKSLTDQLEFDFQQVTEEIVDANLPEIILERSNATFNQHNKQLQQLISLLGAIKNTSQVSLTDHFNSELEAIEELLNQKPNKQYHVPLEVDNLPRRLAKEQRINPRMKASEFTYSDNENKQQANISELLKKQAHSLNHQTLTIFNWVRNNIVFTPTYGVIQGAEGCLIAKKCNAFDAASLLVKLLIASDIKARYRFGTIELASDIFAKALGNFSTVEPAIRLARQGKLPIKEVKNSRGQIVAVRFEHVWVEALTTINQDSQKNIQVDLKSDWTVLETVLKPSRYLEPIKEKAALQLMVGSLLDDLLNAAQDDKKIKLTNTAQTLERQAAGGTLIADIPVLDHLPKALPWKIIAQAGPFSHLPQTLQYTISIVLTETGEQQSSKQLNFSTETLAKNPLFVSYRGAEVEDQQTIEIFGGLEYTPPFLVNLKAVLHSGSREIVLDAEIKPGETQTLQLQFQHPLGYVDPVTHKFQAGTQAIVGLNLPNTGQAAHSQINITKASTLSKIKQLYFSKVNQQRNVSGYHQNVVSVLHTEELLAFYEPDYHYGLGQEPLSVNSGRYVTDVRRSIIGSASRTNRLQNEQSWLTEAGQYASLAEQAALEKVSGFTGISTVRLLDHAQQHGHAIVTINKHNSDQLLPELNIPDQIISDIQKAISAGHQVLVPEQELKIGAWQGVGYIIKQHKTGVESYMLSGGFAGGITQEEANRLSFVSDMMSYGALALGVMGIVSLAMGVLAIAAPLLFVVSLIIDLSSVFIEIFTNLRILTSSNFAPTAKQIAFFTIILVIALSLIVNIFTLTVLGPLGKLSGKILAKNGGLFQGITKPITDKFTNLFRSIVDKLKKKFGTKKKRVPKRIPVYTNLKEMLQKHRGEERGTVKYLNKKQRKKYLLHIKDGKLYDAENNVFDTGSIRAIFVMDEYGSIYATKSHRTEIFQHSSFLSGRPVASAGEIKVTKGSLTFVNRRSGHYKPTTEHLEQFLQKLRKNQVNMNGVKVGGES